MDVFHGSDKFAMNNCELHFKCKVVSPAQSFTLWLTVYFVTCLH